MDTCKLSTFGLQYQLSVHPRTDNHIVKPTIRMESSPSSSPIQEPPAKLPAWCWLVLGVLCISLAIFGLVVDDINGGPNERSVIFWLIFGFITLVGMLLAYYGFFRLSKERKENDKA